MAARDHSPVEDKLSPQATRTSHCRHDSGTRKQCHPADKTVSVPLERSNQMNSWVRLANTAFGAGVLTALAEIQTRTTRAMLASCTGRQALVYQDETLQIDLDFAEIPAVANYLQVDLRREIDRGPSEFCNVLSIVAVDARAEFFDSDQRRSVLEDLGDVSSETSAFFEQLSTVPVRNNDSLEFVCTYLQGTPDSIVRRFLAKVTVALSDFTYSVEPLAQWIEFSRTMRFGEVQIK
jgi:hypothetical protein